MKTKSLILEVSPQIGNVSAEIVEPENMIAFLVFAHGAGAGMKHPFIQQISAHLAQAGIGSLRFNFPFIEQKKKRPDFPAVAEKTVEVAIQKAHELFPQMPLFAGGKSFGGRMTSQYMSKHDPGFVKALVFFGFPLHAPGKPSVERAAHLKNINVPMYFLQGTRDTLATWALIENVCSGLPNARLIKIQDADHAFRVAGKDIIPVLAHEAAAAMKESRKLKF